MLKRFSLREKSLTSWLNLLDSPSFLHNNALMEEEISASSDTSFISKLRSLSRGSILFLFAGFLLLIAGWRVFVYYTQEKSDKVSFTNSTSEASHSAQITIDISGAVVKPGVYKLSADSRVETAIKAAGGFSAEADSLWIDKYLNKAAKLKDAAKIYIPEQGKNSTLGVENVAGISTSKALININTASKDQLDILPQIGPAGADKIITNRPYQTIDELVSKSAVTQKVFDKLKDLVSVY